MDKCIFCAGGPAPDGSAEEFEKYGSNRLAEGKLPACAEKCSTKALLGGDGDVIADIMRHRFIPIIGYTAFSWLARLSINLHNYMGPLFIVCALVMFFTFLRDNLWRKHDLKWIKKGGGFLTGEHVPSGRFNAGEKTWFWFGVFLLTLVVGVTGLILDFGNFGQGRGVMQQAHVIHVTAALIYIAAFFGHLYMGTIGTEGAYGAMRHGYVDETWAREHHELWYNDIKAGKVPAGEEKLAEGEPPMQPARE